jgi:hypothetical protein
MHRDLGPSPEFGPPPLLFASRLGKSCLVEFFLKFELASPPHFPLGAVGLPPAPSKSREHPRHREARRADHLLPAPPSRRPPGERPSPRLCPAPPPSPAGANPNSAPAPCPMAGHRRLCHRGGPVRGDRPERAPSALRRNGLAGPQWSWQPGPVPIWPSELSGPPTREHHRPWAECEAQYCAVVLIFFQFILIPRNCFKLPKFVETCRNV